MKDLNRARTAEINRRESAATSRVTSVLRHAHDTSLISLAQNFASQTTKRENAYGNLSSSLLKNKNLLVPTRLALKRQRAAMRSPLLQYEPIQSETYQIELGNTNETSQTPQTLRNDITLMYRYDKRESYVFLFFKLIFFYSRREKPFVAHPITGDFLENYREENGSPSPCSYVLPRKSCREKNAPAYSFGTRCLVEKSQ